MADARMTATAAPVASAVVELAASDLVGHGTVACPNPRMTAWSSHPKVFLAPGPLRDEHGGTWMGVRCPYCGTLYRVRDGDAHAH